MRVTSELFVAALLRRAFSAGGFGAVARRGAAEAGAVFVTVPGRMGETRLYGPAPQTAYETERPDERLFRLIAAAPQHEIDARLEREQRFDPDIWVVEIELEAIGELMPIAAP